MVNGVHKNRLRMGDIAVRWHHGNGEWARSIGYGWNRTETKLIQKDFYFGDDDALALAAAAEKIAKWKKLKANWSAIAPTSAPLYVGKDLSKPFWIEKAARPSREQEAVKAVTPIAFHTAESAKALFKREREERIG